MAEEPKNVLVAYGTGEKRDLADMYARVLKKASDTPLNISQKAIPSLAPEEIAVGGGYHGVLALPSTSHNDQAVIFSHAERTSPTVPVTLVTSDHTAVDVPAAFKGRIKSTTDKDFMPTEERTPAGLPGVREFLTDIGAKVKSLETPGATVNNPQSGGVVGQGRETGGIQR